MKAIIVLISVILVVANFPTLGRSQGLTTCTNETQTLDCDDRNACTVDLCSPKNECYVELNTTLEGCCTTTKQCPERECFEAKCNVNRYECDYFNSELNCNTVTFIDPPSDNTPAEAIRNEGIQATIGVWACFLIVCTLIFM
eukprot:TRINITY_DN396_c0_g1_i1.p2 TRINITY_DN396_c0_g1~~TRINITY_DN396_c0_g1_i1.p2  ORF type:complete len:142 (-),score=48.50 TRINITY_DN396_c0_g1_i1:204-629(-)